MKNVSGTRRILATILAVLGTVCGLGCGTADQSTDEHAQKMGQADVSPGDTSVSICDDGWYVLYYDLRDDNGNWLDGGDLNGGCSSYSQANTGINVYMVARDGTSGDYSYYVPNGVVANFCTNGTAGLANYWVCGLKSWQ